MNKKIVMGLIIITVLALFTVHEALAWGEKVKVKEAPKEISREVTSPGQVPAVKSPEEQQLEREKNILIANFNAMSNQELTVNVLQQLLNREIMELKRMQAVFCDQYKLNPEKWRQGLYEYDAASGKFLEKVK